jgi:monofunctional biosynthetic peptidoglycan transglycosylase
MGWPRWLRFAARASAFAAVLSVVVPVTQCVVVRFVNPWATPTMLQRVGEHLREKGELRWVDYRTVRLASLPEDVPAAVLTSEDQRFYDHDGFDFAAIRTAYKVNQTTGGLVKGGSTISQQVAKNLFLWQRRSWLRKGLEAWYVIWLELIVPKDRILELYLEIAETGPMTFGFDAGARRWFQKPASDLTTHEAALITSLLPNPIDRTPKQRTVRRHADWIQRHLIAGREQKK